ncbi:MAG: repeat protein [Planctomycetota bacterium]|nr:repeat protein [Planctomycetota bacterium]
MHPIRTTILSLSVLALGLPAFAGAPMWKKHDVNPASAFEAAGVLDADGDGKLDIISGTTGYRGPSFQETFKVREVKKQGTYYNSFSEIPMDVNGDGKPDFVSCSYFGKNVGWVENPGSLDKTWTYHEIDVPGPSEAAVAIDLTGDGKPEILPNTVNVVVFYILEKAASEPKWKKVDLGTAAAGHGVGTGDVNGDGKLDIITPKGWFEATGDPSDPKGWTWHGEFNLGATGIQILGKDIDGDGLTDLVYGMGHDRGLLWVKQVKGTGGERAWSKPMMIDDTVTSVHTQVWADLDGDGQKNELVSGKRVYAHEVETGDVEASQVAYYTFDRDKKEWRKHPIFQGEPAKDAPKDAAKRDAQKDFPRGTAGTGLEMTAIDIDGDGDIDLVCPGKSGLYWFENLSKSR